MGAPATVPIDVLGTTGAPCGALIAVADAPGRGADAAAIVCGVAVFEGSVAVAVVAGPAGADRATSDVSSGLGSDFHQAKRGPDWQPATTAVRQLIQMIRCSSLCMMIVAMS